MAFTTPRTWVTGELVTATMMQQQTSDNISDLDSRTQPQTASVATSETTTSTTYTDLTTSGPAVTITTGTVAVVGLYCAMANNTVDQTTFMGFAVSSATTVAAADAFAVANGNYHAGIAMRMSALFVVTGLTAGSNVFTAKYRVAANTGTFADRKIIVWPGIKLS